MELNTWILGKHYSGGKFRKKILHRHISSLIRMTYRKDFPVLSPYPYSDDSGWGCMLRSAQSMMAQTLIRHYLGDDWIIPEDLTARRNNPLYTQILSWFIDAPGVEHVYSIHNMVQSGMKYDKLPGEWYGPSTAAYVLRDITAVHHQRYHGQLKVYVTTSDTIYISEVYKLCASKSINKNNTGSGDSNKNTVSNSTVNMHSNNMVTDNISSTTEMNNPTSNEAAMSNNNNNIPPMGFYDPLYHPPPGSNQHEMDWDCGLLVIIPLKLGVYSVSERYQEELLKVLHHPHCVGILGGKPNHAIYFIGYQIESISQQQQQPSHGKKTTSTTSSMIASILPKPKACIQLLGLDPHTTYSATCYHTQPFPSVELSAQLHPCMYPESMIHPPAPPGAVDTSSHIDEQQQLIALSTPPCKMPIDQLDPSIGIGFYFRNKQEFDKFYQEKTGSNKTGTKRNNNNNNNNNKTADTNSILYSIEYAPPSYDYSAYEEEEDSASEGINNASTGVDMKDDNKDDEYVFI